MLNKLKTLLANDVVERSLKTFVQTFLATLAVGVPAVDSWTALTSLAAAALAAAVSAVWNSLKK